MSAANPTARSGQQASPAASAAQRRAATRGILWMLATMLCFILLDTVMKYALEHYSLVEVTWARFFFATLFTAMFCGPRLPRLMHSTAPGKQALRSAFLMITTGLFNAGVMHVALPTATTIMFMTPIITTLLSVLVLGEHVGIHRWSGIAIGFLGAIIVVQPWNIGSSTFNASILFLVAATVTNASYQIVTRQVRQDDPLTSLLFTAVAGAVVTSLILPWFWTWPDAFGWSLLAAAGLAGALGHLCIIQAFRAAPASVVAPFSYSSLVWATAFGYLIWRDIPGLNVWLGAALIVSAGLYIFVREHWRSAPPVT